LEEWLKHVLENNGVALLYAFVILILVVCGMGMPVPEEATFLAAGFAGQQLGANVWILCVCGVVGIMLGDSIPFYIGSRYGASVMRLRFFSKILSEKNRLRAQDFFHRHGSKTIFIARFVAGLRMPTFFMAGTMGVKYRTFFMWDLLGALISCPTSIWLAYTYGQIVKDWIARSHVYVFGAVGLIVLYMAYHIYSHREKPAESDSTAHPPAPPNPASQAVPPPVIKETADVPK
jgi:membrane protein DedA with SNARE-associated domain